MTYSRHQIDKEILARALETALKVHLRRSPDSNIRMEVDLSEDYDWEKGSEAYEALLTTVINMYKFIHELPRQLHIRITDHHEVLNDKIIVKCESIE